MSVVVLQVNLRFDLAYIGQLIHTRSMTSKAKPILIIAGAILITFFPVPRWIATRYVLNATPEYFSVVTFECKDASVLRKLDAIAKQDRDVQIKQQRNTTLWEIGVYDTDPNRAAEKANRIAINARDAAVSELRGAADVKLQQDKLNLERLRAQFAKDSTEQARQELLVAEQKYNAARFDSMISQVPVKMWQRALPAGSPTRPNGKAILDSADIIGWLLCVSGVVLVLVGLLRKPRIPQADANAGQSASKE